jgi:hypothetical protein
MVSIKRDKILFQIAFLMNYPHTVRKDKLFRLSLLLQLQVTANLLAVTFHAAYSQLTPKYD